MAVGRLTARWLRAASVLALLMSVVLAERVGFASVYDVIIAAGLAALVGIPDKPKRLLPSRLANASVPYALKNPWPPAAAFAVVLLVLGRWPAVRWMYNDHWLARLAVLLAFVLASLADTAMTIVLGMSAFLLLISLPTSRRSLSIGWLLAWATLMAGALLLVDRARREGWALHGSAHGPRRFGRGAAAVALIVVLGAVGGATVGNHLRIPRFNASDRLGGFEPPPGSRFSRMLDTGVRFSPGTDGCCG